MTAQYFRLAVVAVVVAGCGDNQIAQIVVVAPAAVIEPVRGIAALVPATSSIEVRESADPTAELVTDRDFRIGVVVDIEGCAECFRIDAAGERAWLVHASDVLGAQYGVAAALEDLGFRFRHPFDTYAPRIPAFDPAKADTLGIIQAPATKVRGFQLHTLHPIEPYYALWEPGEHHRAEAERILSWIVANRGNYIQWFALDNIMADDVHAAWRDYTAEIIASAHARGLRTGLELELFGQSNLQRAFDLSDDDTGTVPLADELAARLPRIIDGLPFDAYDLAFGEFFGAEPDRFVAAVDESVAAIHARSPAEVHAVIHVGDDQRVDYMGETNLLYYFLVKYCDPSIIPEIHTVMFYDLYEDAGGAYHHDNFDEHRAYLMSRLGAGLPALYQPESAYWIAFDDSVPLFLPLYVRDRWLDLDRIRTDPAANGNGLTGQVLFSSGWEWGYWLNDYTAMRDAFAPTPDPRALLADAFGADLAPAVDVVAGIIDDEKAALLDGRLVAYLAGRDGIMDAGRRLGIVSQPDRVAFDDLAADPALVTAFAGDQLPRLAAFADAVAARADQADALPIDGPWADELRGAIRITALRARFAATEYEAAIDQLTGMHDAAVAAEQRLHDLIAQAEPIVAARRLALHWPDRTTLLERGPNETVYGYGYLMNADTLCYWHRELAQLDQLLGLSTDAIPSCLI